ncbi:hypothetical protein PCASD_22919 [Puccinia coronata f. sp. avenae]|uniref:Integrase SAM-like N-terminal domain-containing protein n=1 Tax=Puccinia coronata f. sp. avenae TaxID=200324 RepID=A0A2N5SAI9_9BASI|nr:hypothetical protein PCASD_22919 [Puccinia coronata f. sp. avenae]
MPPFDLSKIPFFVKNGSAERNLGPVDLRVLKGWQWNTLVSYNAAIKKFARFKASTGTPDYILPITPDDVYAFVAWAGRGEDDDGEQKINASSINKYLFAIKSWHTFHAAPYPYQTETRMKLMLKASGKQDATVPQRREKSPVLVADLTRLFLYLEGKGTECEAV